MSKLSSPVGIKYAGSFLAGYLVGRLIPHGPLTPGDLNFDRTDTGGPRQFHVFKASRKRIARCNYVAEKLSGLSETLGKEASCGDRPLPLRQVCLEGIALPSYYAH